MAGDLKHYFTGRHLINARLTGPTSSKDTRHHEIGIDDPQAQYLPGDALGIHPQNDPALVDRILAACDGDPETPVPAGEGATLPARQALIDHFNLATPSRKLFESLIARGAADLAPLLDRANAEQYKHFVGGWNEAHDVLDLLEMHPQARLTVVELVESLTESAGRIAIVRNVAAKTEG